MTKAELQAKIQQLKYRKHLVELAIQELSRYDQASIWDHMSAPTVSAPAPMTPLPEPPLAMAQAQP